MIVTTHPQLQFPLAVELIAVEMSIILCDDSHNSYLKGIKDICKGKAWFAERLQSYFKTEDDEDFREWMMEYNYDIII